MIFILLFESPWIWSVNRYSYELFNSLAGQSWIFDTIFGLALSSSLIKAGLIGACFMFAWLHKDTAVKVASRRKVLLITLLSSVVVLGLTKLVSQNVFLPRPFVASEKRFHLEKDRLVESPRLAYNVPYAQESEKSFRELGQGQVHDNDLRSFPSDHAGFFITIALGIFLAYRRIGVIALLWTIFVPLMAKMVHGQHYPLDIVAGAGLGIIVVLTMQKVLGRWGDRVLDPVVDWTMRNSALTGALLFLVLFEVTNTLDDVRQVGRVGKDVVKQVIGRQVN